MIEWLKKIYHAIRFWSLPKYFVTYFYQNKDNELRYNYFVIAMPFLCIHQTKGYIKRFHKNPISEIKIMGISEISQKEYRALSKDIQNNLRMELIEDQCGRR